MTGIESFPPNRRVLASLPNLLMLGGLGMGFGGTLLAADHMFWGGLLAIAGLIGFIGIGLVLRRAFAPVRLTDTELSLPRPLGPRTRLPLRDITGLGMQYTSSGRASGWKPYVWPAEGERIGLNITPPQHSAPEDKRGKHWLPEGVAPHLDWDYVAASPAGQALQRIADQVRRAQGPYGSCDADRREEKKAYERAADTAYWAPDGRIGLLPGARPVT